MRATPVLLPMLFVLFLLALAGTGAAGTAAFPTRSMLDAHNRARAKHCAGPLSWSSKVASSAQRWANTIRDQGCAMRHSGGVHGENLAMGTQGSFDPDAVVGMWYGEVKDYSFRRGSFSMKTGHFTQLVWRGTTEVGCGRSTCKGLDVWVCQYAPPGNVEGGYRENVQPTGCR